MDTKKALTISDIAQMAGVSKSTVSRALNDSPLIGQETKDRIRKIAQEHDFKMYLPAQCLSLQRSRILGFVTNAQHFDYSVADLFTLEILSGIIRGAADAHYDLLVVHVDVRDTQWPKAYLDSGRVDGFILMTSTCKTPNTRLLAEMKAPFITWGISELQTSFCTVCGDNFSGGKLATQHLIQRGRRKIAFLGGPEIEKEVQLRYAGYVSALADAHLPVNPCLVAYDDYCDRAGGKSMKTLLEQNPDLDSVFVNSDLMAISAIKILQKSGRRVPDDVAVVGYDDLSIAEYNQPALTTIRQNIPLAGKLLAQNLVQYLQTGLITHVTMPVELIAREST